MTTYQSMSLHVEDSRERSLAFTVADNPAEDDYALKAWSTVIMPDNQAVNIEVEFTPQDVRELQSYLRDRFGSGTTVRKLPENGAVYPHQDGDVTMLGPEVFAASDGSVISYKGTNYYRPREQETGQPVAGRYCGAAEQHQVHIYDAPDGGGNVHTYKCGGVGIQHTATPEQLFPATAAHVTAEQLVQEPSLADAAYTANDQAARAAEINPATGLPVNPWPDGPQLAGEAPRQCPVIYDGVQCLKSEGHDGAHDMYQHAPMTGDGSTVNAAPAAAVDTEPSEAEKGRRRRLKVEMEFDTAKDEYDRAVQGGTFAQASEAFEALAAAYDAVKKREPDNSRVRQSLDSLRTFAIEPAAIEAQTLQIPTGPVPAFAPEPPAGEPVQPTHCGSPIPHESHGVTSPQGTIWCPGTAAPELAGANYLAQANSPMVQEMAQQNGGYDTEQIISTEEAAASQAFPCPQRSADNRPCIRPFGHELATATNPEPKPHVYPTSQQMLEMQGQQYGVQPIQQHPSQGFIAPAAAGPVAVGPLSFQVPPTPEQAAPHPDLVQQPSAPAAPFWQAPQT